MLIKIKLAVFSFLLVASLGTIAANENQTWNQIKIASVQYPMDGDLSREAFYQKISQRVIEAKRQGAQLVLFPELVILDMLGRGVNESARAREIAQDETPAYFEFIGQLASQHQVAILGGSAPRLTDRGTVRNTSILALNRDQIYFQDKLFMTPDEVDWGWEPGTELHVRDLPWGKTVTLICLDSEIPQISNHLAPYRVELFLVPSMTGRFGLERVARTSQARAIEHRAFVALSGVYGGQAIQWNLSCRSAFYSPSEPGFRSETLQGNHDQSEILYGDLNLQRLRRVRNSRGVDPARLQNARNLPLNVIYKGTH